MRLLVLLHCRHQLLLTAIAYMQRIHQRIVADRSTDSCAHHFGSITRRRQTCGSTIPFMAFVHGRTLHSAHCNQSFEALPMPASGRAPSLSEWLHAAPNCGLVDTQTLTQKKSLMTKV